MNEQSLSFAVIVVAAIIVGTAIGLWLMPLLAQIATLTGFLP